MKPKSLLVVPPLVVTRDAQVPVELQGLAADRRDAGAPVEIGGLSAAQRDARVPLSVGGAAVRDARLPAEWGSVVAPRDAGLPLAFTGTDPNLLLHRWLVLVRLESPLLHAWAVHSLAKTFPLTHQWAVKEPLAALPHRWNVMGDLLTPFGASRATGEPLPGTGGAAPGDVQRPVATKTKAP